MEREDLRPNFWDWVWQDIQGNIYFNRRKNIFVRNTDGERQMKARAGVTAAECLLFLICMPTLAKINLPIIAYTIMAVVLTFGVYLSGCYAVYRVYGKYVPAEEGRALNAEIKKARRDAVLRKILLAAMLCIILLPRIWQELN